MDECSILSMRQIAHLLSNKNKTGKDQNILNAFTIIATAISTEASFEIRTQQIKNFRGTFFAAIINKMRASEESMNEINENRNATRSQQRI